jgi:hypothetical protein
VVGNPATHANDHVGLSMRWWRLRDGALQVAGCICDCR